jgi:hypothetical protein
MNAQRNLQRSVYPERPLSVIFVGLTGRLERNQHGFLSGLPDDDTGPSGYDDPMLRLKDSKSLFSV